MSDYVKLTDYAAKDALLSGNPAKIIKGVDIGADFDAVAVAVATKWDASVVNSATSKTTPVDADLIPIVDSAASNILKKLTWANLKATLLTWLQGTVFPSPGAIGGTTPSTGAFTTLSASGATSFNAAALWNNGQAAYWYEPGTTTWWRAYSPSANLWKLGVTGGDILSVNTGGLAVTGVVTTTGNATIGNASATTQINVLGTGSGTAGGASINVQNGGTTQIAIGNYSNMVGGAYDATPTIYSNGSLKTYVVGTGTVTTVSSTGLAVTGALSVSGTTTLQTIERTAAGDLYINASNAAGQVTINTAGAERVRVDSSGNLGLGVTPSAWSIGKALQVNGTAVFNDAGSSTYLMNNAYYNAAFKYYASSAASSYAMRSDGSHQWYIAASGTAGNAITFTQAMSLDASGNLLVGTASPAANTSHNFVNSVSGTWAVRVANSHASSPFGETIVFSGAAPNGVGNQFLTCQDTGATRVELRSNGGLANYSANNVNLSDARLKTDFQPAKSYYEKWVDIDFITYLYKDQTDTERNLGVTAQQLESVFPELIDNSGFGEAPEGEVPYKAVYQTDFQYATAKALQEAIAEIESLKAYKAQAETVIQDMLARMTAAGI